MHIRRDEHGRIVGAGGEDESEGRQQDGTHTAAKTALLHFSCPREAATVAAFLRTRVYRPESLVWLEGYQACSAGGPRTTSPACTPSPTTPKRRWV